MYSIWYVSCELIYSTMYLEVASLILYLAQQPKHLIITSHTMHTPSYTFFSHICTVHTISTLCIHNSHTHPSTYTLMYPSISYDVKTLLYTLPHPRIPPFNFPIHPGCLRPVSNVSPRLGAPCLSQQLSIVAHFDPLQLNSQMSDSADSSVK